jgi:tetratricopeptide (TPR) repeat protein
MKILKPILFLALFAIMGCREDPDQAANKLLVESTVAWDEYLTLTKTADVSQESTRLDILNEISSKLDKIVTDYSGSALAVELISTGGVGKLRNEQIAVLSSELIENIECRADSVSWMMRWKETAVNLAYQAIDSSMDDEKIPSLAKLAKAQFVGGDKIGANLSLDKMLKVIKAESKSKYITLYLAHTANVQALVGDIAGAILTANSIVDAPRRFQAVADIAKAQAASGDITNALLTVNSIDSLDSHDLGLAMVAAEQARAGDSEGAGRTLMTIPTETTVLGVGTLIVIIEAQRLAKNFEAARHTVDIALRKLRPDDFAYDRVLTAFAEVLEAEGNFPGAIAIASSKRYLERRIEGLANIAVLQVENGDLDGARATVALAINANRGDIPQDGMWQKSIIEAQIAIGDIEGAIESVKSMNHVAFLAQSLTIIAEAQVMRGECAIAGETMNLAFNFVKDEGIPYNRGAALNNMLESMND